MGLRRSSPEQPVPVEQESIVVIEEITINSESVPTAIVTESQELHGLIEEKLSTDVLQELDFTVISGC